MGGLCVYVCVFLFYVYGCVYTLCVHFMCTTVPQSTTLKLTLSSSYILTPLGNLHSASSTAKMEVEPAADGAAAAAGAGADAAPESQQLVDELGQLLERLPTTPNNVQLLRRQVDLMLHLGMHDEIGDAVAAASRVTFLGEARWLSLLSAKLESPSSLDLDQFEDMLDLLTLAEGEYICG